MSIIKNKKRTLALLACGGASLVLFGLGGTVLAQEDRGPEGAPGPRPEFRHDGERPEGGRGYGRAEYARPDERGDRKFRQGPPPRSDRGPEGEGYGPPRGPEGRGDRDFRQGPPQDGPGRDQAWHDAKRGPEGRGDRGFRQGPPPQGEFGPEGMERPRGPRGAGGPPRFEDFDTDSDGSITKAEFDAFHEKRFAQRPPRGPMGPEGAPELPPAPPVAPETSPELPPAPPVAPEVAPVLPPAPPAPPLP